MGGWKAILLGIIGALALAGCDGSSSQSTTTAAAGNGGCGKYCAEAAVGQSEAPQGYPCPQAGCLKCPPSGCMSLETTAAKVSGNTVEVKLTCKLRVRCEGALLLCAPHDLCGLPQPGLPPDYAGRLAGSDFVIPAGATASLPVRLTAAGQKVARAGGRGYVLVDMRTYGDGHVTSTPPTPQGDYYQSSIRLSL